MCIQNCFFKHGIKSFESLLWYIVTRSAISLLFCHISPIWDWPDSWVFLEILPIICPFPAILSNMLAVFRGIQLSSFKKKIKIVFTLCCRLLYSSTKELLHKATVLVLLTYILIMRNKSVEKAQFDMLFYFFKL